MRGMYGTWGSKAIVASGLWMALPLALAQNSPPRQAPSPQATRLILVQKGHALESRGRPDMAIQLWQQILLSDPNNIDALVGMARDLKLTGSDKAPEALDRLRKASPNNPDIAKIEALTGTREEAEQLRRAGELARQGKSEDAMRIYRQLYGDHPPDGDIALAYYQTLYGTASGKQEALKAMRALAARNPGDSRPAVELGTMLTYDPKTRAEGVRLLKQHPSDANAQAALRQALVWDSANPASSAGLRDYLKDHPQDTELASHLKDNQSKLAQMNSGIARTPAERDAFAALNAHHLDVAEQRFTELLAHDPRNGRLAAGVGFLRMQQNNFGDAIGYLNQAQANGYKTRAVDDALATSRFWLVMGQASQAAASNQFDDAAAKYRQALVLRPSSPEALNGLAGLLVKQRQYAAAASMYDQLIALQPASPSAWLGLFLAHARAGEDETALAVQARFPASVKAALTRDPEYLRTLASVYQSQNRPADAQRVLAQALTLPFPANGATLKLDTKLQYAAILMDAKRFDQAAALYAQILADDPANLPAWMGTVAAHHGLNQDAQAIDDVQRMPRPTYEAALADPGFLSMLAAMYQGAGQLETAQDLIDRCISLQIAAGKQPGIELQLQQAGVYLARGITDRAYPIYLRVLSSNPNSPDAWKGLIATLQSMHQEADAIKQIDLIPAPVRKQLEADIQFLETEATLYAAAGDFDRATRSMRIVEAHYARLHTQPPANIEIQNSWLLFNSFNDRLLYPSLMRLGGRADLTIAQRETVQNIWAQWAVRRAAAAFEDGNAQRAIDILDAAKLAFPGNLTVLKAVAGGYIQVGRAREALALFRTVPMQQATVGGYQGAIGAALAANDKNQAEQWLRQALERYPRDPAILSLAAHFEQARGDNQRAAAYYRATLAAMPSTSPAQNLAHVLVYPDQDTRAHRAATPADLQHLLDPDSDPFPRTSRLPPPPPYGVDPESVTVPQQIPSKDLSPPPLPASTSQAPVSANPQFTPQSFTLQSITRPRRRIQTAPQFPGRSPYWSAQQNPSPRLIAATFEIDRRARLHMFGAPQSNPYFHAVAFRSVTNPPRRAHLHPVPQAAIEVRQSAPAQSSAQSISPSVQISADPPHSPASDAWKGLIVSLMASSRNGEALDELAKIPPALRSQLEADVEFEQAEAGLYAFAGDLPRAAEYLSRVQAFYILNRLPVPAAIDVQHAWLLYNLGADRALYPVLLRLDNRADLTSAERDQLQSIWANWAVRRAEALLQQGSDAAKLRGVQLLQSAAQDFPDDTSVRAALAGGYARIGRSADALALFKAIPMQSASSSDFQGAINAAIGAADMQQAESWLRQALPRFPNDPQILASAARYEQARGHTARAADYWRASLAAMPSGAAAPNLEGALLPQAPSNPPGPGNLKRLLDPRVLDPVSEAPSTTALPPLPAYPRAANQPGPALFVPAPAAQQQSLPPTHIGKGTALANIPARTASGPDPSEKRLPHLPALVERKPTAPQPSSPPEISRSSPATPSAWTPLKRTTSPNPAPGLRITSQPTGPIAAQAQVLFAEQTDSQLTPGSAVIHDLPNAQVGSQPAPGTPPPAAGQFSAAQYTPSAQEAATGAYSALRQQQAPTQQQAASSTPQQCTPQCVAAPAKPAARKKKRPSPAAQPGAATPDAPPPDTPTLAQAPAPNPTAPNSPAQSSQAPGDNKPPASDTGLSDDELQQRDLPPLRGPWIRIQRNGNPISPREEAEMQLRSIESGYSGWLAGTGLVNYRSGTPGYDQLAALEAPFEFSAPLGYNGRFTVVAQPVFLDSGQADGTSVLIVKQQTTSGTALVAIPQPIGTATNTDVAPPAQQNAVGVGGELQLAFPHLALAAGYSPAGFLVATATGRVLWKPANGPITLNFSRDPVRDTQLSYAGLRDPAGDTLGNAGQIWGGVVSNQGQVQFARGDAQSGFYFGGGGQYLTGYHVQTNQRFDGSGGAYWRLKTLPEYGNLSVGINFFGMHYAHYQGAFTHGMGGYFSPQAYFLANVPFTWAAHYGARWHYNVLGSLGVQAFQQDQTPLWPLAADKALEVSLNNPMIPAKTSVGPNYDLRSQMSYQIGPHWFTGAFVSANNSRNYTAISAGFAVHYMFRAQPSTAAGPTGIFPTDGLRPFTVP